MKKFALIHPVWVALVVLAGFMGAVPTGVSGNHVVPVQITRVSAITSSKFRVTAWNEKAFPQMSLAHYRHDLDSAHDGFVQSGVSTAYLMAEVSNADHHEETRLFRAGAAKSGLRVHGVKTDTAIALDQHRAHNVSTASAYYQKHAAGPVSPPRRYVLTKTTLDGRKVAFMALHFPQPKYRAQRATDINWLKAHVTRPLHRAGYTLVIGGDFNQEKVVHWGDRQAAISPRYLMQIVVVPANGVRASVGHTTWVHGTGFGQKHHTLWTDHGQPTTTVTLSRYLKPVAARVASFNMLGAVHTAGNGNHSGYASGAQRAKWAAAFIRSHRLNLVGTQEDEAVQMRALARSLPGYRHVGHPDNSIWIKRSDFAVIRTGHLTIPYFRGPAAQPWALVRNKHTGAVFYFYDAHNPANVGASLAVRKKGWRIEAAAFKRWEAKHPVVAVGDKNDARDYKRYGLSLTDLHAAGPGKIIDWITGSPGVQFTNWVDHTSGVQHRITDHTVPTATVRIRP